MDDQFKIIVTVESGIVTSVHGLYENPPSHADITQVVVVDLDTRDGEQIEVYRAYPVQANNEAIAIIQHEQPELLNFN